jgi:hypothetical protein
VGVHIDQPRKEHGIGEIQGLLCSPVDLITDSNDAITANRDCARTI